MVNNSDLPDKCLLEVYRLLPLYDALALSQTCKRMKEIAPIHFSLALKCKMLTYATLSCELLDRNLLLKDFLDCFESVLFHAALATENSDFGKNVQSIHFVRTSLCKEEFQKVIIKCNNHSDNNINRHTKSLTFGNTNMDNDLSGCISSCVPQLERLRIFKINSSTLKNFDPIFKQSYWPKLRYFGWHVPQQFDDNDWDIFHSLPVEKIAQFLKTNHGVRFVSLEVSSSADIDAIYTSNIVINEMFWGDTFSCQQDQIQSLVKLCERNPHIWGCISQFSKHPKRFI